MTWCYAHNWHITRGAWKEVGSSKARDLLGWTETDPHEALHRSVAWHLGNPPGDADADFSADDRALAAS
jgi:hypothetical protein